MNLGVDLLLPILKFIISCVSTHVLSISIDNDLVRIPISRWSPALSLSDCLIHQTSLWTLASKRLVDVTISSRGGLVALDKLSGERGAPRQLSVDERLTTRLRDVLHEVFLFLHAAHTSEGRPWRQCRAGRERRLPPSSFALFVSVLNLIGKFKEPRWNPVGVLTGKVTSPGDWLAQRASKVIDL